MSAASHRVRVWITNDSRGPQDLKRDGPKAAEWLGYSNGAMDQHCGWTPVGYAHITLELDDTDQLIQNKIDSLRMQAQSVKADATRKLTTIDRQINELLALPMETRGAS